MESNIKDIIECFNAMAAAENFELPSFVTDNCNFPSLDLKHIDAATLCQDVISLKKEFSKVREDAALISAQVATISEIKESLEDFKSTMKQSMELCRCNADKHADITFSKTGNKELPSMQKTYSAVMANTSKNSDVQNRHKKGFLFKEKSVEDKDVTIFDAESTSWIKVKPKKKEQRSISHNRATTNTCIGKKQTKIIKTATRHMKPAEVFVSRLHTDTSEEDIKKYVPSQFKNTSNVECEKLKTRFDTYKSFRVTLHDVTFHESMNLDNWPEGVLF